MFSRVRPKVILRRTPRKKLRVVRHNSNLKPLSVQMTNEERRAFNRMWYWRNREKFLSNPAYSGKFVLVDNGEIKEAFDGGMDAIMAQTRNDECFLTVVGDEGFFDRSLLAQDKQDYEQKPFIDEPLLLPGDIVDGPLFKEPVPLINFHFQTRIVRDLRPWWLLPIRLPKDPATVLPVWFFVDSGSPVTRLEQNVFKRLFGNADGIGDFNMRVPIPGFDTGQETVVARLSSGQHKNVNIVGCDFLFRGNVFAVEAKIPRVSMFNKREPL